jgi:hypothetical protein
MTRNEFMQWVERWRTEHALGCRVGDPDFGTEDTLEDWLGSLHAFAALQEVARSIGGRK